MISTDLLTDDEFLAATGVPSVPSLKKVLLTKLVLPIYTPLPGGGRERRWSRDQIGLVRLVARLAGAMGVSLQTTAELLRGLDPRWCDETSGGEAKRLLVGDRVFVWVELHHGEFHRLQSNEMFSNVERLTRAYQEVCVLRIGGAPGHRPFP